MLKAILHTRPVRQLDTIFTSRDLQRLGNTVEVMWGKDEQMPEAVWSEAKKEASILIGIPSYGVGAVDENAAPHLKAIMEERLKIRYSPVTWRVPLTTPFSTSGEGLQITLKLLWLGYRRSICKSHTLNSSQGVEPSVREPQLIRQFDR